MNNDRDFSKQLEAIKREVTNVIADMHARKLAVPAGALLAAIVLAVVLLPKSSTPPAAPPVASAPQVTKTTPVAQISLVSASTIDEDVTLTNSADPFIGYGSYKCAKVSSNPKTYNCKVADLTLRVICTDSSTTGPCGSSAGSTSGTGATGGGDAGGSGGSGSTGSTGDPVKKKKKPAPKTEAYYTVDVSIDGKTEKGAIAGDELPDEIAPLVVYAGTNDDNTRATFLTADGVTATGVTVDPTFGSFLLKKGQTVTLTDVNGAEHKLTLKKITKVTK